MRYRREKTSKKVYKRVPRFHFPPLTDRNYDVLVPGSKDVRYIRPPEGLEGAWGPVSDVIGRSGRLVVTPTIRRPKQANLLNPTARFLRHERWVAGNNRRQAWLNVGYDAYDLRGTESGNVRSVMLNQFLDRGEDLSDPDDEKLRTEAILEAMAALKDQKMNAGVMLAESKGVADMAVDVLQLITSTRLLIRKGDFEEAYRKFRKKTNYMSYPAWKRKYFKQVRRDRTVRMANKIPQSWLYYHFGIKPTIDDITAAVDTFSLRKTDLAFGGGGIVRGYAKKTTKKSSLGVQYAHFQAYRGTFTTEELRSVRVAIRVQPKASFLNRLSNLGVTNPPEAIWNAVPFSWFVDYFTTFGEWLGALDAGLGWTFSDAWTESWRTIVSCRFHPESDHAVTYAYPVQDSTLDIKVLKRNVIRTTYGPMGSVLPHFKRKGPSVQQFSNMLSVAAQLFR